MRHVVITGASTGIGYAATQELIQHDYHVFGSVRNTADGERLQAALGANFTPLYFDVTDEAAIRAAAATVQSAVGVQGLLGLVNNAGIAVGGPLLHLPVDEFRHQFEVNVFGLLRVTQAFAGLLGARQNAPHPPGRIINISSVSGRIAYPFIGPYAASKHAVEAISDSLRRELRLYGVDVIVIEPGAVRTPIWEKLDQVEIGRYASTDYGASLAQMQQQLAGLSHSGMPPQQISRVIRQALESARPRVRYAQPNRWLVGWILPRWLPARWFDWLIGEQLGLKRQR